MRIAIDGRQLTRPSSGFKTYTFDLLRGLARTDRDGDYLVYLDELLSDPPWGDQENFGAVVLPKRAGGFVWKQAQLPLDVLLQRRGVDAFHFLCNSPSFTCPGPLVFSIHDLSFKRFPGMIPRSHYLSLSLQMPLGARRARKIITVSKSAKEDICRFFGVEPGRVEVIPNGVGDRFVPIRDQRRLDACRRRYGLPDQFILYTGSYLPHKNLLTLLKAFNRLPLSRQDRCCLVFVGPRGRNYPSVHQAAARLGLLERVMFLGLVEQEDLPAVYSLADVFAFPSLWEGFGLPPLEAMACGTPVVASKASSIPEVVGQAGVLVDPGDVDAWTAALERVLAEPDLRVQMAAEGVARASGFSWEEAARRTRAVYQELGA